MADEMHLVRDVLDKQLLDREGRKMGKADGIVLLPWKDGPPRVLAIESGAGVLGWRLGPSIGRWIERTLRKIGPRLREPVRIPIEKIRQRGVDLHLDVDAIECGSYAFERWLSENVIGRIPGSAAK